MRLGIIVIALIIIAALVGGYYCFYYPPHRYERIANQALRDVVQAVATKDRAKISASLNQWIADDATIRLEVGFFSLSTPNAAANVQDFDKASFVHFIDNVLYPLSDYGYEAQLQSFVLTSDHLTAQMQVPSKEWADGVSYYGGAAVGMRFTAETTCDMHIRFENLHAVLTQADCKLQLHAVPKT